MMVAAGAPGSKSEVFFSSLRLKDRDTRGAKLNRLIRRAGLESIDFTNKFTAIKMHFGEAGNTAYLRPDYARVVVDAVRSLGGRPFLTDCNTLYPGRRKNALEHLDVAFEHGFSPLATNCQIIIGDGLAGSDEALVPVSGGEFFSSAKIGRAIMDADVLISLNHFKGHIEMGIGGALKNIGMGCASRAGKMEMHSAGTPAIDAERCIGCRKCQRFCANDGLCYVDGKARIVTENCVGCGHCIAACPFDAIMAHFDEKGELLDAKVAEYAQAVLAGRPHFHISLAMDITPLCDCWLSSDAAVVPDIGMFASFDPVALDLACVEALQKQPVIANSMLGEALARGGQDGAGERVDYIQAIHPHSNWRVTVDHAVKLGIGSDQYELIEVD